MTLNSSYEASQKYCKNATKKAVLVKMLLQSYLDSRLCHALLKTLHRKVMLNFVKFFSRKIDIQHPILFLLSKLVGFQGRLIFYVFLVKVLCYVWFYLFFTVVLCTFSKLFDSTLVTMAVAIGRLTDMANAD